MSNLINPFWEVETIPSGLISYYRFDSFTVDQFGSNDFTESTGLTFVAGKSGNAVHFNGGSSYTREVISDFSFTDGAGNDEPFSLSMYVKWDSVSADWLVSVRENTSTLQEWNFLLTGGDLILAIISESNASNRIAISSAFAPNTGQWYHLVCTYDGSGTKEGLTLYIDGSDVSGTQALFGTYVGMDNTGSKTILGHAWVTDNTKSLEGAIDGLGVWGKELSSAEVTQIYDIQNAGNDLV